MRSIRALLLVLAISNFSSLPVVAQKSVKPLRPPGTGWFLANVRCIGFAPLNTFDYCPVGKGGTQTWFWNKILPKRTAIIAEYLVISTGEGPIGEPGLVRVNCSTWEWLWIYKGQIIGDSKDWEPIPRDPSPEYTAEKACGLR